MIKLKEIKICGEVLLNCSVYSNVSFIFDCTNKYIRTNLKYKNKHIKNTKASKVKITFFTKIVKVFSII